MLLIFYTCRLPFSWLLLLQRGRGKIERERKREGRGEEIGERESCSVKEDFNSIYQVRQVLLFVQTKKGVHENQVGFTGAHSPPPTAYWEVIFAVMVDQLSKFERQRIVTS